MLLSNHASAGLSQDCTHRTIQQKACLRVHPTASLPLLVVIDMFSVSLVVPLLLQYYKTAGVTSAAQREMLSSLYYSSQIVGGLALGAVTDAGYLSRRTVLLVSFGGSALSYALIIVQGRLGALLISRVLVGLVKQTMTVTMAMLTDYTNKDERTKHLGRLSASSTIAWIAGPTIGAFLYKHVDQRAPPLLASLLFLLNMCLAAVLLPRADGHHMTHRHSKQPVSPTFSISNLKACFSSRALGSAVASLLIFTWFSRATSYSGMASYYEEMYGLEPHHRGYLSSYQQALRFMVQSILVGPLLRSMGGERRSAVCAAVLLAVATLLELQRSLSFFIFVLCPAISLAVGLMELSLRCLVTHVAPKESMGSVLAALDVLQNTAAITVPVYRTMLFTFLAAEVGIDEKASMKGDPDPMAWIVLSGVHWVVAAIAMGYLLLSSSRSQGEGVPKKDS